MGYGSIDTRTMVSSIIWSHSRFSNTMEWIATPPHQLLGATFQLENDSGGGRTISLTCDTISLRRASLHPETTKILMLVKKKFHLVRAQSTAALRN
jgi:hypothetical protein